MDDGIEYRWALRREDPERILHLVAATGFFSPEEQQIAIELAEERFAKGVASGYEFVTAEQNGRLVGYACYGPIAGTKSSHDLYWIAVHPELQRRGLGQRLMELAEAGIRKTGGTRVYVDTSSRKQYAPTRAFYERAGYTKAALLDDFYAPGDGKVIYVKVLENAEGQTRRV
jgi:ribosomal protein S18 acetylase RimI-like enzyme